MDRFHDKVAVITGAGGGVGSALAKQLAERGCHLALVDINEEALRRSATAAITGLSSGRQVPRISVHRVDITDKAQMAKLPDAVLAEHGKVNYLINNAGITYQKSFATPTLDDWEKIVGINWWGVLYGCHFFLDAMKASEEGHIVNMSSMSAMVGLPGQTSYCATKAAVNLLSESMWAELEKFNIGVTSVRPGAIKTDMIQATLQQSDDLVAAQRNYRLAQRTGVTPDHVARRILKAIEKKHIRIRIGTDSVLLDILKRLFPVAIQKLFRRIA